MAVTCSFFFWACSHFIFTLTCHNTECWFLENFFCNEITFNGPQPCPIIQKNVFLIKISLNRFILVWEEQHSGWKSPAEAICVSRRKRHVRSASSRLSPAAAAGSDCISALALDGEAQSYFLTDSAMQRSIVLTSSIVKHTQNVIQDRKEKGQRKGSKLARAVGPAECGHSLSAAKPQVDPCIP